VEVIEEFLLSDEHLAPDQEPVAAPPFSPPPAIHTSKTRGESYLIISDLQIPFEHERALTFCRNLAIEYNVPPENIYNVGDEVDFHAFSRWPIDADATYTPVGELAACRERLAAWYGYFPEMKLCLSNHGQRILKKAAGIQLPSQLLRTHAEILAAPPTWRWANTWQVKASRHPFQVVHGHEGGQSVTAQRTRSLLVGRSTVWGHMHASPGVHPAQTSGQAVWGCCAGSLIDRDAYAFHYNKGDTFRPWVGCAVIKDGGRVPILEPLE